MSAAIKGVLHSWCGKNHQGKPVYSCTEERPVRANGARSSQPTQFNVELRIAGGLGLVTTGKAKAIKLAQTAAAVEMCRLLIEKKLMSPKIVSSFAEFAVKPQQSEAVLPASMAEAGGSVTVLKQSYAAWQSAEVQTGIDVRKRPLSPPAASTDTSAEEIVFFGKRRKLLTETREPLSYADLTDAPDHEAFLEKTLQLIDQSQSQQAGPSKAASRSVSADSGIEVLTVEDDELGSSGAKQKQAKHGEKQAKQAEKQAKQEGKQPKQAEKQAKQGEKQTIEAKQQSNEVVVLEDSGEADVVEVAGVCSSPESPPREHCERRTEAVDRVKSFVNGVSSKRPGEMEEFDKFIWLHYRNNAQNDDVFEQKMTVLHDILKTLQTDFGECYLFPVGSTVNGCGSYNSDMDLCLVVPDPYLGTDTQRSYALNVLRLARRRLQRSPLTRSVQLIPAKVPILKLTMRPPLDWLELDINCNNVAGIHNSHLLHYYSRVDARLPALSLLVKHWAIKADINDALNGTLNSYSLILLVIHYLQYGVEPAVLPNLQDLYPQMFNGEMDIRALQLQKPLPPNPLSTTPPINDQSLAELAVGFFAYYTRCFEFTRDAISIRRATRMERFYSEADAEFYQLFVEEPFDGANTARCVTKPHNLRKIRTAFRLAVKALQRQVSVQALDVDV